MMNRIKALNYSRKFNRLVVVDEDERVQGVVSARDLVAYFLEQS